MKSRAYPKSSRLLRRSEYLHLSEKGIRVQNRHFIALFLPGSTEQTRIGITVSKRVGKAVTRNRIKRFLREHFRKNRKSFRTILDISIIARKETSGLDSESVFSSLDNLYKRIEEKRAL